MAEPTIVERLHTAFDQLAKGLAPQDAAVRTCVLTLQDGARWEVFRAEPVPANATAWRVRGFVDGTDDDTAAVGLAAIMATRDGRAILTSAIDHEGGVLGGPIESVEHGQRSLGDLSAAIAAAVRQRLGPPPTP